MKIKITKLLCKRCGHQWVPRREDIVKCPKCQSPYWSRDYEKEERENGKNTKTTNTKSE